MGTVSDECYQNVNKRGTVRIELPEVNTVHIGSHSILAAVFIKTEDSFYTFGTTTDSLKHLYARFESNVREEIFFKKENGLAVGIILRQTVIKQFPCYCISFRQFEQKF